VVVTDPWADPIEVKHTYGITLGKVDRQNQVDSLIVAVGHDEYRALDSEVLRSFCKGSAPVLADVKSLYDRKALGEQGFSVFRL
jgi:UDP-N-acetyl-D-galactosamine dehydrogenase